LSTLIQYLSLERIGIKSVAFFAGVGFISGQLGQRVVDRVIKRTGRPSYVIFLLASVIGVATLSMVVYGSIIIANDYKDGEKIFEFDTDSLICNE